MKRPLCLLALAVSGYACVAVPARSASPPAPQNAVGASSLAPSAEYPASATIPGPLRSFLRMAAISQKVSPDEALPLVSRNVSVQGYQYGKPTEFLVLLRRYMDQARELVILAGAEGVRRVTTCGEGKPQHAML